MSNNSKNKIFEKFDPEIAWFKVDSAGTLWSRSVLRTGTGAMCTRPSLARPRGCPKVPGRKPTGTSAEGISPAWLVPVAEPGLMPLPTRDKWPLVYWWPRTSSTHNTYVEYVSSHYRNQLIRRRQPTVGKGRQALGVGYAEGRRRRSSSA